MMDDRELLEMAAKAAGYNAYFWSDKCALMCQEGRPLWNPLTDDGDALRLATDLELNTFHASSACYAMPSDDEIEASVSYRDAGCKYAATRRAIVRAAAEIGRAM